MKATRPTARIGISLVLVACAMAMAVHLHPERLKAPAWVAFFALGLLAYAGCCVIAQALGWDALRRWLVCVLPGAMAVIPGWIALGGGPRRCTVAWIGTRAAESGILCRGAFGIAAAILAAVFVLAIRGALRSRDAA